MATAFETFVNTELPLRPSSPAGTAGNMLRIAVTGLRGLEERSPAQVLADIGAAAASHTHVAAAITDFAAAVLALLTDPNIPDNLTLTNITQITNRSHTSLSDIGTNTHAQIDTHIADATEDAQDAVGAMVDSSLVYADATPSLGLAAKHKTVSRIVEIEPPTATDVIPICYLGDAGTIIAIRSVVDSGTVSFNIEQRGKFTPWTAGTDCMTADQAADTDGEERTSSFADATVPADTWLVYVASATTGTPTKLAVSVEYTID